MIAKSSEQWKPRRQEILQAMQSIMGQLRLSTDRSPSAILCLHPTDNSVGNGVVVGLGGKANRQ